MRFDMHCHLKGGSIDSHVRIERYIELLRARGFSGMLVTDHDTYRAYDAWAAAHPEGLPDFTVLRGIEYDTKDAGHFLVVMPDGVDLKVLTIRGMSVRRLIDLVHAHGGILGPAHPFGARSSSAMFCRRMKKEPQLVDEFDFLEGLNTCEKVQANRSARALAERHGLPTVAGSDSHRERYIGTAYTDFSRPVRTCDDLIAAVREGAISGCGGTEREFRFRHHFRNIFPTTWGFKAFNRSAGFLMTPYRRHHLKAARDQKHVN